MIRYKLYQNQITTSRFNGYWYARAVCDETYDTQQLAKHMSGHNTPYSPGVIHGVLKDMIACIKELLLDGKNVKLDDLAIFDGQPVDIEPAPGGHTETAGKILDNRDYRADGALSLTRRRCCQPHFRNILIV